MTGYVLFGPLQDASVLCALLGRDPIAPAQAVLRDVSLRAAGTGRVDSPYFSKDAGAHITGTYLPDLPEADLACIAAYASGMGWSLNDVSIDMGGEMLRAKAFDRQAPEVDATSASNDVAWGFEAWHSQWGEVYAVTAQEIAARSRAGQAPEELVQFFPFIQARAWARILAKSTAPTTLRSDMCVNDDVVWDQHFPGFNGFFQLKSFEVRRRNFDNSMSGAMPRSGFVAYDAALVLPYDPVHDLVLLVEQMRFGPLLRGDAHPWILEPPAGLVDAGEDPTVSAQREVIEETGLELERLELMTRVYASPGYSTEFFHCYLGLVPMKNWTAGVTGVASENENIKSHVLSFEEAMALCDSGEINAGPLVMMLYWLARHRDRLRKEAGM